MTVNSDRPPSINRSSVFYDELQFATRLAEYAGEEILTCVKKRNIQISYKEGGEAVTNVDTGIDAMIRDALHSRFSDDALLTEEGQDTDSRTHNPRVWIVDPIDGTSEFIEYATASEREKHPYFGVHIGLSVQRTAVVGVVYFPALQKLYFAEKNKGAMRKDSDSVQRLSVSATNAFSAAKLVLHPRRNTNVRAFGERCGVSRIEYLPSTGARICGVAEGLYDVTASMHGRAKEWDICAPGIILQEAGGTITNGNGRERLYNQKNVQVPFYIATNTVLHAEALRQVGC